MGQKEQRNSVLIKFPKKPRRKAKRAEPEKTNCPVYELASYRNKAQRSTNKSLEIHELEKIQILIEVYQEHMESLATEPQVQKLFVEKGLDPQEKIRTDVERLHHLVGVLKHCLEKRGANNLAEASRLIRYCGDAEVNATLDLVLTSDYVGFQYMAQLLAAS